MTNQEPSTPPKLEIPCPECRDNGRGIVHLVIRVNRKSGHDFLGCPQWPECSHTQPVPEYLKMIQAGQPTLF